jgi:hypothetical protein
MGCEPPLDSDLVRAADDLLDILRRLRAERPAAASEARDRVEAWTRAEAVLSRFDGAAGRTQREWKI